MGECGGYMVLGDAITGADDLPKEMLGLLPHKTSFAEPKLHLGYRKLSHSSALPWPEELMAHEFHYARITSMDRANPLFKASNAAGRSLPDMGIAMNNICGSFAHVIGPANC